MKCEFCDRIFKTKKSRSHHAFRCKNNPDRIKMDYSYMHTKESREKGAKTRSGKPLSIEHRQSISISRKKFLDANPDQAPYLLNHSSRKSWPEKFFEHLLKTAGITGWVYSYPNGRYHYDYAFPELKVDVEIDGGTHQLESVIKLDRERDEFSTSTGWRVLRIAARNLHAKDQHQNVIDELIKFLNDDRIFGKLEALQKIIKPTLPRGESLKLRNNEKNISH